MKFKKVESFELNEMARVGIVGHCEIFVNTNDEGWLPHFHIRDVDDWDKFHTCIKICSAEYFLHGNKKDKFKNNSDKKDLQKFMTGKVQISKYKDKFKNNWELICFLWDLNNSDFMIDDDVEQPDYTNLN